MRGEVEGAGVGLVESRGRSQYEERSIARNGQPTGANELQRPSTIEDVSVRAGRRVVRFGFIRITLLLGMRTTHGPQGFKEVMDQGGLTKTKMGLACSKFQKSGRGGWGDLFTQ